MRLKNYQKERLLNETSEQKELRKIKNRETQRLRRLNETSEQKEARLIKDRIRDKIRYQKKKNHEQ